MKKVLAIMLCFVLFASVCFADEPDYASMTDDELRGVIKGARDELTFRQINADEDILLFEKDGVYLYLTRKIGNALFGGDYLQTITINNSNKNIDVLQPHGLKAVVNGWDVYASSALPVEAGHKSIGNIDLSLSDAGINSYDEVEEVVFDFDFCFEGGDGWEHIGPITVQFPISK